MWILRCHFKSHLYTYDVLYFKPRVFFLLNLNSSVYWLSRDNSHSNCQKQNSVFPRLFPVLFIVSGRAPLPMQFLSLNTSSHSWLLLSHFSISFFSPCFNQISYPSWPKGSGINMFCCFIVICRYCPQKHNAWTLVLKKWEVLYCRPPTITKLRNHL